MFENLLISILNMSITASLVILVVLLVRLLLKKAPKIFSYALWSIVLFRLLCPFSFESTIGLLPMGKTPIPQDIVYQTQPQIDTGIEIVDNMVNPMLPVPNNIGESINPLQIWLFAGSLIWVIGILVMTVYSILQFVKLKRNLIGATPLKDNIYLADHIGSPFVMGFVKPRIYLPSSTDESEQAFIIAHEKYHIKRLDHVARILGFIALTLHWFNPLAWLAFCLSGKDMEMSCDEAVMKKMETDIRQEYSKSLLQFATSRKLITATPLAFGEGDTKERIKNVMRYKKPILWVSVIAVIVVIFVMVGFSSNNKNGTILGSFNVEAALNRIKYPFEVGEILVNEEIDENITVAIYTNKKNSRELQNAIIETNGAFYNVLETNGSITIERPKKLESGDLRAQVLISWYDKSDKYVVMAVAYDEDVSAITYLNQELIQIDANGYQLFYGFGVGEYKEHELFDKNGNRLEHIKE